MAPKERRTRTVMARHVAVELQADREIVHEAAKLLPSLIDAFELKDVLGKATEDAAAGSFTSMKAGTKFSEGTGSLLLDIGFGWGGVAIRAAETIGCRVHGVTLSKEQKAYAEAKVRERNLEHLITFELMDYRTFAKAHPGEFDR